MKLYQQIALAIRNNKRESLTNILPEGVTLNFNSFAHEYKLVATHEGIEFNVIVTPEFINGFQLGWSWAYADRDKLTPAIPHLRHVFTELLNRDVIF